MERRQDAAFVASVAALAGTTIAALVAVRRYRCRQQRRLLLSPEGPPVHLTKDEVIRLRSRHCADNLTVSYANTEPLMIMRGKGSRLFDEKGVSYLDTRNNVCHVGHCHPFVVRAVQEQVALLNTNTRYLHPNMVRLAERLARLLPDPLEKVFFCNSGSEANDLALRLARAYSGSTNTIVVERAYHGHTLATLEVSPYKFEGNPEYDPLYVRRGVTTAAATNVLKSPSYHIWQVPCPDVYRGKHRDWTTAGREYAFYVQEACRAYQGAGQKVRAFIVEGGMSVAGCVLPPPGYLESCAKAVREAGGLYVADEVQTGFGRLGSSSYWAFQYRHSPEDPEVVPDIVTVGKPFGNGIPLAAVITTPQVAAAFERCGVELFNTFAGSPVATAAGLAVLQSIEDDRLVENAEEVGAFMKTKFQQLGDRLHLIGDVRGSGLFLGVELVRDRLTHEPAPTETSFICSVLKSKYKILTSIDGFHDNVVVIKPPMVFSRADAKYFLECFEKAATEDLSNAPTEMFESFSKTPT